MENINPVSQVSKYTLKFLVLSSLFWVGLGLSFEAYSQSYSTKSKKAVELYKQGDNMRVRGQYGQAIRYFQASLDKDKKFAEAHYLLGLCHARTGNLIGAKSAFLDALEYFSEPKVPNQLYFELANTHFSLAEFDAAKMVAANFLAKEKSNEMAIDEMEKLLIDIDYTRENTDQTSDLNPEYPEGQINIFPMQYFPVLTADQKTIIYTRIDQYGDEDLVYSTRENKNGPWGKPFSLSENINTNDNEGTCSISADGRTIVYTACNAPGGLGRCDLYISFKIGDDWSAPLNMGPQINSPAWESQPSLSADGRTIYFVSDRTDGYGGRDIWYSTRDNMGNWMPAENMGQHVNTKRDELSPFIDYSSTVLYFSSNGHPGYGGYDLFKTNFLSENSPRNLGMPVNTRQDQLSFFITQDRTYAYYSIEPPGGRGRGSRLAMFELPEAMRPDRSTNYVYGIVSDSLSNKALKANIELWDIERGKPIYRVQSDSISGNYLMVLTQSEKYALYVNREGYMFKKVEFEQDVLNLDPIELDVKLKKPVKGSRITLNNIYFDFDSDKLLDESKVELEKVFELLHQNPNMRFEISGHTDNQGTVQYNLDLSERRAKAVYTHLIGKGVNPKNLQFKGYGDKYPISSNETAEGRAKNRRIVLIVL